MKIGLVISKASSYFVYRIFEPAWRRVDHNTCRFLPCDPSVIHRILNNKNETPGMAVELLVADEGHCATALSYGSKYITICTSVHINYFELCI